VNRKKKFVIAAGTFAGLVAVYVILRKFPHATELEDLTPEEREAVERRLAEKAADLERVRSDLEMEAELLPPRYRGSWMRQGARRLAERITGD